MNDPTARQLEIHAFMIRYQEQHGGLPPTYRDIRAEFGFSSTNAVSYNLAALAKLGLVVHHGGQGSARGWVAVNPQKQKGTAA